VAFDLCGNATQQLLGIVRTHLQAVAPAADVKPTPAVTIKDEADDMVEENTPLVSAAASSSGSGPNDPEYTQRYNSLQSILSGEVSITLQLEFLHRKCHSDLAILKNTKVGRSPTLVMSDSIRFEIVSYRQSCRFRSSNAIASLTRA